MHKRILVITTAVLLATGPAMASRALPVPPGLEPNVRFWERIYTEVTTSSGLIHDSRDLDVVYEVVDLPQGVSTRTRERHVERIKKHYRAILETLARGKRTNLSPEETRVLALWPADVSNATLRAAATRVRFQLGQADKFRDGLIRSGRWRAYIEEVMGEHGVPAELSALPHVESSFNPRAYSRVGAAGLWQFTRSTGRLYMRVDHVVDERMDPWKATIGAARLLRDNYRRLGEWPLAITAYNHGVAGMARAVRKTGTRDLDEIVERYRSRIFGFASRNFYAEFLAASAIQQDPERFFGRLEREAPSPLAIIETDHYYKVASLQRALGVDRALLEEYNLALRPSVWNGAKLVPKGYPLRVPTSVLGAAEPETLLAAIPASERLSEQKRDRWHTVRRGEALSIIARRYGVRESELVALNNLRSRHRIRAGQVLRLPDDGSATLVVTRAEAPADGLYEVRRGDSLTIVAARFGVGINDLVNWNQLRNKNRLAIGQRLRVAPPPVVVAAAEPDAAPPAVAPPPAAAVETVVETDGPAEEMVAETDVPAEEPTAAEIPEDEPATDELPSAARVIAAAAPVDAATPDPSNYAVFGGDRVTVQAEETLGHYAEWLEVSASRLRRLNNMRYGTPLVIGRTKRLDFSRVTPEVFEQRRLAYHRDLQEEFFAAYVVAGTQIHTLRRGDSIWYLANEKYQVPIWLLRQYNPDVDFGALPTGTPMVIPVLERRSDQGDDVAPTLPVAASLGASEATLSESQ